MANPCGTCKFDTLLGCALVGTRSGIETLAKREAEKGAPNDALNQQILKLCETLEVMCEEYRMDVASYEIAEQLRASMGDN